MPRLRAANNVSSDELIQLVTILKAEGEFPEVEPEVKIVDANGNHTEHAQAVNARKELNAAVECLEQFSSERLYASLQKAIKTLTNGKEDAMTFVVRKRIEMLAAEKADAAKLQVLKWMEGIIRAVATSHLKAQERLCIRKPSGAVGNSLSTGSPFADFVRQRQTPKAGRGASGESAGREALPPC